jgi:acyl-CoA synthetase (AMP-forming)/AMP-acid ligase II
MAFIRRPLQRLSTISRYGAHTSGGPNFAFDACVAAAGRQGLPDVDLRSWQVAFNGAEPIRPETLHRFAETFAPCGFRAEALYPCYGLAEATLLVTGSRKGRGGRVVLADTDALTRRRFAYGSTSDGRRLVGSGCIGPDDDVRIVDPETGRAGQPDQVGEMWLSGPHVAQGYWRRPQATADTFQAELDGRTYLRTGDLGVIVDGELYVVGRLKDLVIIRGRNHYPQDIEHTAGSAHPALLPGSGAAFTVPDISGERLIVVQEVRRDHVLQANKREVVAAVRAAVTQEHQLALGDLVLTMPGQIPKTSSGKVMRSAARKRYLDGSFKIWTAPAIASTATI